MTLDLGRRRTRYLPNSRGIAADPHPERHSCQCRPIIGRMAKKPPRKKRAAARPASKRPERQQDPRLVAVEAKGEKGEKLWVLVNSPVDLDDGSRLIWHPPQPVAFNLVEAKRFRDRGVKARTNIMAKLKKRPSGDELSPTIRGRPSTASATSRRRSSSRSRQSRVSPITSSTCLMTSSR